MIEDQSTEKSFILEDLTGLSFLIASDLCTCFATQIVLCCSSHHKAFMKVSIISELIINDDEAQKQHLLAFEECIEDDKLSSEDFASILDNV